MWNGPIILFWNVAQPCQLILQLAVVVVVVVVVVIAADRVVVALVSELFSCSSSSTE